MMKYRKLAFALALSMTLLAGCGGSGTPASSAAPAPSSAAPAAESSAPAEHKVSGSFLFPAST